MNIQNRLKKIENNLNSKPSGKREPDFSRLSNEQLERLHELREKANEGKRNEFNPKKLSDGELIEFTELAEMIKFPEEK